jgi:hypothetical protein
MKRKSGTAAKIYVDRVPVTTRMGIMYRKALPEVSKPKNTPTVPIPNASGNPANKTRRLRSIRTVVSSGLMISPLEHNLERSQEVHHALKKKEE